MLSKLADTGPQALRIVRILGLMPHTLYLGSGLVQSRLRDFDVKNSSYHEVMTTKTPVGIKLY
jgi:metal iron transporter